MTKNLSNQQVDIPAANDCENLVAQHTNTRAEDRFSTYDSLRRLTNNLNERVSLSSHQVLSKIQSSLSRHNRTPMYMYRLKNGVSIKQARKTLEKLARFITGDETIFVRSDKVEEFIEKRRNEIYSESFHILSVNKREALKNKRGWYHHPSQCLK